MDIRKSTVHSIKWQVGMSILQKIISFGTTMFLARILGPSVYGLFALGLVIINSFGLFKSFGMESALIQRKDSDFDESANTAFLMIPTLGIIIYLLLFSIAPAVGKYLNNQELGGVIKLLGIIFVVSGFSRVPLSILEREMKYRKISIAEICGTISFTITALVFAYSGHGIWSLVYGYIASVVVNGIMIWIFAKWKPRFTFDRKIASQLFNFGKFVFLGYVTWFLRMNLDNFLVGKLLGVTILGLYAVAFNITNFSSEYFGDKVYRVAYPAYSKLQNNLDELRSVFSKILTNLAIVAFPIGIGIFVLGGDFIRLAYGDKWIGATNIVKILAWAGIFNTLPLGNGGIFLALGRPKLTFWFSFIQLIIFLLFITPAARLIGATGVAWVIVSASFVAMVYSFFWVMKLLALDIKEVYANLKPAFSCSLLMALGILFLSQALKPVLLNIKYLNFLFLFCFAILVYFSSLYLIDKSLFRGIRRMVMPNG